MCDVEVPLLPFFPLEGALPLMNIVTTSRRRTLWTGSEGITPLQALIDSRNTAEYDFKHPDLKDADEGYYLNRIRPEGCRCCPSTNIKKHGFTSNGIQRYKCKDCGATFTILTGTIFDNHRIPVSEWVCFCLYLFKYQSFSTVSWDNRNADNTTRYWVRKFFLMLQELQDNMMLKGDVYIDETFWKVTKKDILQINGKEYRGISRNQMCIAIGYDGKHVYCHYEGRGKTSAAKTLLAFGNHIEPKSNLIHDMEKSHGLLAETLELKSRTYNSNDLKGVPDKDNPLNPINQACARLKKFFKAHPGFDRDLMQDYLNLFTFFDNPPADP